MLMHPTLTKLRSIRLNGMAKGLEAQQTGSGFTDLSFEERLGLLVDQEITERENSRLTARLKQARLRQSACVEDIDYRHPRGLDKSMLLELASGKWIKDKLNLLITGPTGVGKSYLACALGHRVCLNGLKALYFRASRLFQNLEIAKGDGTYAKRMNEMAKADLVIMDDWGLSPLTEQGQRDFLEILEDRYGVHSTLVTSQLPVEQWHGAMGNPTVADAILDRLVHNAYKINLKGGSMRKQKSKLT